MTPAAARSPASSAGPPAAPGRAFAVRFSRYWHIVLYRALAGLKSEQRQNYLGYLWFLLEPVLNTLTFYVIFGVLQGNRGINYIAFLLIGTTVWQWFDTGISGSLTSIRGKVGILNCYDLPKYIFPLVQVTVTSIKFFCAFAIVLIFCSVAGFPPAWVWLWLPVLFAIQLLVIIGLALPLTILVTLINDASLVISAVFRILFFLSGVFFGTDRIPAAVRPWFYANPVAALMDSYRKVILEHTRPDLAHLAGAAGFGLVACAFGLMVCARVDKTLLKSIAQ